MTAVLQNCLVVGAILFALGAIGFLTRRNLIVMFLSAEMMLQGVAINLVAFGMHYGNLQGQAFVTFMLTVAACEAGLALALVLALYRNRRSLDVSIWQDLREAGQDPIVDDEPLEPLPDDLPRPLPILAVAGRRPALDRPFEQALDAASRETGTIRLDPAVAVAIAVSDPEPASEGSPRA